MKLFRWNPRAFWQHGQQGYHHSKAQKHSKDIGKTVHVTSVVQPWFHEARGEEWREELLNEVIILVFFEHKKYSRSFIKWRLNMRKKTWGWVINDRMFIFEWTIPLKLIHTKNDNYKGNYKVL